MATLATIALIRSVIETPPLMTRLSGSNDRVRLMRITSAGEDEVEGGDATIGAWLPGDYEMSSLPTETLYSRSFLARSQHARGKTGYRTQSATCWESNDFVRRRAMSPGLRQSSRRSSKSSGTRHVPTGRTAGIDRC